MFEEAVILEKGITNVYKSPLTDKYEEERIAVLHWYQANGWEGYIDHGESIEILLDALLPQYEEIRSSLDLQRVLKEGLEKKEDNHGKKLTKRTLDYFKEEYKERDKFLKKIDLDYCILNINAMKESMLEKRIETIINKSIVGHVAWEKSIKLIMTLFDSLDNSTLAKFAFYFMFHQKQLENKYCHLPNNWARRITGWPPLIIYKNKKIKLIGIVRSKRKNKETKIIESFCKDILEPHGFETGFVVLNAKKTKDICLLEEKLYLTASNDYKNKWVSPLDETFVGPEKAIFDYFQKQGWEGTFGEGDIIFMLLKCMFFRKIPKGVYQILVLHGQVDGIDCLGYSTDSYNICGVFNLDTTEYNGWEKSEWGELNDRLNDIRNITTEEIENNFEKLMPESPLDNNNNAHLNRFTKKMMGRFSLCFDREQLIDLAKILSMPTNSYKFSYGWPDLTLFKDGKVIFREVKAKSDKLRENQEQLFFEVLQPLGFDVKIIRLLPEESS